MARRATIEPLGPAHFADASRWLSDPAINCWLYAEWRGRSVDERLLAVVSMSEKSRLFLIQDTGAPVGVIALSEINRIDSCAGVWYVLGEHSHQNRGLVTTAVAQLLDVAFGSLQLHSVHASVMEGNKASQRVLEKSDFRYAGRLREAFLLNGRFVDRLMYDKINPAR